MTLTCKLVRDFYPVYVTAKQKADICNSIQVTVRSDRHTQTCRHSDTPLYQVHHICHCPCSCM